LVPHLNLNDGNHMPQLGFGVFQVPEADTAETVTHALNLGYRAIDTAAAYGNEAGVRDAVLTSELDRGELFITTKLRNRDHGRHDVPRAFEQSLERLGGHYIDLYLIHWPISGRRSSSITRRSSGSPPPTAALLHRSCSAGTSSSGTL